MCVYIYLYLYLKKQHIYINLQITYTSPVEEIHSTYAQQDMIHVKGRNGDQGGLQVNGSAPALGAKERGLGLSAG